MRVCLICVEVFGWGKYGGFGRSTRFIARRLKERGVDVDVVVPRRPGQSSEENVDGFRVLAYPPLAPWRAIDAFRHCDADIYHSQEASLATYLAMRAMPGRRHIVTFRDHKLFSDWLIEMRLPSRSRLRTAAAWIYERNPLVTRAIKRSDRLLCCSPHRLERLQNHYCPTRPIEFLGSPIQVPRVLPEKAAEPTVLFVARWDRRKRPQIFFELAKDFPKVRFAAVGRSQDLARDAALRTAYGHLSNLELIGFIDQFNSDRLQRLYSEAWVLVNTAMREGLPTTFLEAMAHGCALLSHVNPYGIVERYGYHAAKDDFARGLESLLQDNSWASRGEAGRRFVQENFDDDRVIERHMVIYRELQGLAISEDRRHETTV